MALQPYLRLTNSKIARNHHRQRLARPVGHRPGRQRRLVAARRAFVEAPGPDSPRPVVGATRAAEALGPLLPTQVVEAGVLVAEPVVELEEGLGEGGVDHRQFQAVVRPEPTERRGQPLSEGDTPFSRNLGLANPADFRYILRVAIIPTHLHKVGSKP